MDICIRVLPLVVAIILIRSASAEILIDGPSALADGHLLANLHESEQPTASPQFSNSLQRGAGAIVGYWKSLEKSDMDDQYNYHIFTETEMLDVYYMIPYTITKIEGNKLIISWEQETSHLGTFNRKSLVEINPNGNIRIQYDTLSSGIVYQRIDKATWEKEVAEMNAVAIELLKNSLQEMLDQFAPSLCD